MAVGRALCGGGGGGGGAACALEEEEALPRCRSSCCVLSTSIAGGGVEIRKTLRGFDSALGGVPRRREGLLGEERRRER